VRQEQGGASGDRKSSPNNQRLLFGCWGATKRQALLAHWGEQNEDRKDYTSVEVGVAARAGACREKGDARACFGLA
jgi:hypothetical protein